MQLSVCLCMALWTLGTMSDPTGVETGINVFTGAGGNETYSPTTPIPDPPFPKIYIIAICAGVGGLALIGGSICIGVFVYRKRQTPHHSVTDTDQPLEMSTYTTPSTQSGAQEKFIAMTVTKQEIAS